MPLTSLELTIDQSRPGWLTRAGAEAVALLVAQGRPQMAADLSVRLMARAELSTLQTYLRLHVLPGDAPALPPGGSAMVGLYGPLDGRQATRGRVPKNPKVDSVRQGYAGEPDWNIMDGDNLLCHWKGLGSARHFMHCMHLQPDLTWASGQPGAALVDTPYSGAASDGTNLALLRRTAEGSLVCSLLTVDCNQLVWEAPVALEAFTLRRGTTLVLAEQAVVIHHGEAGKVLALSRDDGRELWSQQVTEDTDCPSVCALDRFLCVLADGNLHVIDLETGEMLWEQQGAARGSHLCWGQGGYLYLGHKAGHTCRYSLLDGATLTLPHQLSRPDGAPQAPVAQAAGDDTVALIQNHRLFVVGMESGYPVRWVKELPPVLDCEDDLFIVGQTLLRTRKETLSAYDLESGTTLWEDLALPFSPNLCWGHSQGVLATGAFGATCFIREADDAPC